MKTIHEQMQIINDESKNLERNQKEIVELKII